VYPDDSLYQLRLGQNPTPTGSRTRQNMCSSPWRSAPLGTRTQNTAFASTITELVLSPLPVGVWAFLGLTVAVVTKTLTFAAAFGTFTNDVIWLIVISFFFARGFVKTGLDDRVATYFVKWLGKSTLGLSYGLALSETLLAPAMPIIGSLSLSYRPKKRREREAAAAR
jgi:di/tricarboxylate transporter